MNKIETTQLKQHLFKKLEVVFWLQNEAWFWDKILAQEEFSGLQKSFDELEQYQLENGEHKKARLKILRKELEVLIEEKRKKGIGTLLPNLRRPYLEELKQRYAIERAKYLRKQHQITQLENDLKRLETLAVQNGGVRIKGKKVTCMEDLKEVPELKTKVRQLVRFVQDVFETYEKALKAVLEWVETLPSFAKLQNLEVGIGQLVLEPFYLNRSQWVTFFLLLEHFPQFKKGNSDLNTTLKQSLVEYSVDDIRANTPLQQYEKSIINAPVVEQFFKQSPKVLISPSARERHAYILGQSGSGKSELLKLFIYHDVFHKQGVLLLDPHGDLAEQCCQFRLWEHPEYRNHLVYISPEFIGNEKMPQYNPFYNDYEQLPPHEQKQQISIRTSELIGAFKTIFKGDFSTNMDLMLSYSIRLLLEHKGCNIFDLLELLSAEERAAKYLRWAAQHWDSRLRGYFETDFRQERFNATKLAIRTRFENTLSNQAIRNIFDCERSTFDIIQLLSEGKTVLVNAAQGVFGEVGTTILGAFITAEVTSFALSRQNIPSHERSSVFVYIDECQVFLNEKIDKILAEGRKYKIHLTMANQFLGQFSGNSDLIRLRRSIMANTAIKICGSASGEDMGVMAKVMGMNIAQTPNLRHGKFCIKAGFKPGYVMQAESALLYEGDENNYYLNQEAYNFLLEEQQQKYYAKIGEGAKVENNNKKKYNSEPNDAPPEIESIF